MKIDRKKIFNRCGFDQRECYELAVRLASLNEEDLINEIKKINVWHYGKCELGLWADVLDRLDTILAEGVTRVGNWTLKLDQVGNEHLIGKIIAILEFTGHLIEHSIYRYLYGSWEHILSLFGTSNMDILHALLGLFYNFSKRSNYFSRLDSTNRKIVLERLDSIAENWGGKQHGFGLAECCDTEYMPCSAGTMQYEFMQDVSPLTTSKEESSQSSDIFIKPKCHRRKLTLRNLHLQSESPSELMENLIQKYNLTNTSDQMALFARLRLCVYFGKPEQRKLLIFTRMQALSILCYTNEVEDKCLSWDIVEELVDVLKLPDREFLGIKACALRTLTAIIHCGKLASCWPVLKNMTGMNSYHGHFPTMMREWISDLVQEKFHPYASTVEQMYTTAILSFLYHLACTNEVNSTSQGNLVGTGLLDSMKEIIMWHTHEADYISFATRAVRVTDQILLSFQLNGSSTNQKSTIDAIVDRLKFEIEICLNSEIDPITKKSMALNTQRVGFIKSMLNLIKRLILDNEWSDTLQSTMDGELPDTLRLIFMNYTTKFNPQLCLFSMEVITNFVYNHPSSMSAMQERQLTKDILRVLTEQPLPVNRDFLVTLPNLLSALSINIRGINEIKESKIIDMYIKTLTDSRFVTVMRNKRIREMMTPSDTADTAANNHSHPSTPTSYQMSNAMNELARANAVVFKPIIYEAISKAFKIVTQLGQKQPAPLLANTKPNHGHHHGSLHNQKPMLLRSISNNTTDTSNEMMPEQAPELSQQMTDSSSGGAMFSNDNSQQDLLAVMNAVEEADREVEQIMEMSGDEDDGVAENEMTQAIDADDVRTSSEEKDSKVGESLMNHLDQNYNYSQSSDDDVMYLMDYICNVCKFMERFLSDQQPEQSLRQQIYSEEGLRNILDILTIPSLPYDFPSSPACQSMQKIFEYLLSWATSTDAILIYKMFYKISSRIELRLQKLEQPQHHSILLKDYVNRSERLQDSSVSVSISKNYWDEHGVCLLHDLVILSTIVVIYDKITDRLSTNLRQDILVELKNGIIDYAKLLPLLNWEAMVLMNLLFEDEEACLEDLKRLCINERVSYFDLDRYDETRPDSSCYAKKPSLSTCQQLFSDNPRSEKIIKGMLQITQKAANDMVELLVTLTKFCCVKPDYSYVVRVRYNRVNGSIPTGKNKLALLNKIAEHCKALLKWESPYTIQNNLEFWAQNDSHCELPVDKACQKILSDIKFLHPMKYFCFTTIHRILTGGDVQKKPFLGFFYAFQMNNGLEVFFGCANELLDTIKYIQYLDPNTKSSVKIMLESFLITVDRMTQIRRITQEFVDSTDKELKDRFDIDLYQRMIRAYMLEPISKLFSFSSLDIDLLNNQSQESLMNIIAFLTSYIFDRDCKKTEPEEATEESIVSFNDEHESINNHIDFIMELGFSRESARRALERNDYDPTQAVSSLFNTDLGSIRLADSNAVITEIDNNSKHVLKFTENSRELMAIETRLIELDLKNKPIKEMIKERFLINLFNLQKEKGIDIITRIVDILLLTGQINEFLEKILAVNGCRFLTSDDSYSSVLKALIFTHSGKEISGANIEDSPNGLHILTLLYNKIRFQVTSSFKNHDMVTRLVKMTNLLLKSFMSTSTHSEAFKTNILKHITQLWLILDQYERTAFALRIRKDVIYEYQGCPTWFWIDDRHGIWHPVSTQHNANINRSYRNGQLKSYSKPNNNNEYVFNFVSLTQKNEESQTERPIMLLPVKSELQRKPDTLSDYESKIISCVPAPLGDEEVIELSDNMLQFLISIKKIDNVYKWDCLQAACYLLIRLCDKYTVANERLALHKSVIPRLCTISHLKGYTQQLVTFVMTLLRQQFETPQLLKHTISDILEKNIPKGACNLHKTTSFNEKLSKDMFYFIWDNIPLLVRDFDTTTDMMTKKIVLNYSNKETLLKTYTISKSQSSKGIQQPMELEKKQIAIVRFLVESALSYYIEKNDVWCELFKKLKLSTEHDLKNMISSPNHLLETHMVVTSNQENNFSFNQQSGTVKHTYKLTGKDFLIYLNELIFSYEQVGAYTINLRLFNRPISFYLVNIYLQEACVLLDTIRSKDQTSSSTTSLSREHTHFQQLVSLQIIEAFLLTVKESYDLIISEIVRNLKMRSHHKDGDCRNTYIVVIMKLLNDIITRLPVPVSKKLVILMYKYRLPNDLCRLLSVVDCSVVHHKSVLVDILIVIDSLCRPDRQMYINKRQRTSKSNLELMNNKRQRRLNNNIDSQISSSIPGTSAATNEITSQEMETDEVFYVDINAWSRNSRAENTDNVVTDNLENLDTSNIDEHPVDVDDDEEMDDYDEVDGVMMSEFRDIDADYDFDEPQMYDDDNNTESETDYEEIEEDEGSAGSQDGDSQGDRFDEDIRDTETTLHRSRTQQEQSRRIFQILNHNYYNINQDNENPEVPRHDPESLRDRLNNVLMTSTCDTQPNYLLNEGFSLEAPTTQDEGNTFRLVDNLYFVTNSRDYDVANQPSNYYPNDLAGCSSTSTNNLIRTSGIEAPTTSQNPQVQTGSQEDYVNGRGWRGLTYTTGTRYMRLEPRTLRQNTIRNILTLNRGSFIDRVPNTRSATNRFVDADLSLDSLEGDFEMQDILGRALNNIPSGWSFLVNLSSSNPHSTINNFTYNDISMVTNFRRWILEARTLYGREITDLVMMARARVYQSVFSKLPELCSDDKDSLVMKTSMEKMVDNIIGNTDTDTDNIGIDSNDSSHDLIMQPDIMIETFGTPNETVIGEEIITPTPSETMESREEIVIDNVEIDQPDRSVSRLMVSTGATGGGAVGTNDDDIDSLSMEQLIAEGIDPSFLEALPPSMRREVIIEHRRANRVRQQLTGVQLPENVDAEIMAQLPPHIQEEILAHYRRENATNAAESNSTLLSNNLVSMADSNTAGLTSTTGVVDSSFLLSLAPGLRREILADMDQSQIANLSTELADEARQVRQETGDAQIRALQANLLSVTGRRRARQLTSGLSDLLSQMNRGRWDQRNIRYVVFSERGQTNRHNNPGSSDPIAESGEWPNLSAYKPLVSTDGLTNLMALLITSSTSPNVMKMISALVNKILQSLTCHSQIRAWISCTIVNILLKISLPKENSEIKPKIFSSPSNSESSILCTPIGSGSCTDMSRSSSIQDDTFRQYPNNKSLFFHSFERGFALTDQVFMPSVCKIYKHKNKSGIQSIEMPEVTIHESVSGSVAKSLIDALSTICSMHSKEFYPMSQSTKIPTNFWFTLAWCMSLKSVSLEDICPDTHLPPNEEYDYFTHLLCLVRLPLMQTNNAMLEKLLLTIHNILKAYYKSFNSKDKTMTEWSGNLQAASSGSVVAPAETTNHSESRLHTVPVAENVTTGATSKEKLEPKQAMSAIVAGGSAAIPDAHLNRVNVKTISHLVNIICAKECSSQAPLPTDKCRVLSERLLIELSKGNPNTKQDIIKLLTANIESVLETLTCVLHKVLDEAVSILEKECNENVLVNEASGSNASPLKKSNTFTESMITNNILGSNISPTYDMAFTSATSRRSQSQVSSGGGGAGGGYSRNNSLPHIAFNQLKMESIKPFTATTGDHLNLLDLFNLLRKVDSSILVQFQSPSPIWNLLSQVLNAIQKSKEPDAVIVFQSLVESFLLCHSAIDCSVEDVIEDSSSTGINNVDTLSHLNTSLVVDTFMNSPAFSELKCNPFVEFVDKHKRVLNHILRRRPACALDQSNFSALLKYPKLLDFDIKRRYFQAKIAQLRNDGDSRYEEELVQVSRARLFEDSYGRLHRKSAEEWKQRFCIKFVNEEGQDGGGLLREWYLKMSHEIFNQNYALFRVSPDGVTYTINPASYVNNNHLSYFKFVGRFIAKAIFDNKLLTCYFTRAFYKHILGIPIRYTDLEKEDYQFFGGLEFLLKNDVSTMFLDQTFSIQISEFGQTETRDLLPNGSQILVTEENKAEYVRLVCQEKMTGAIRQQLHSFLEGFYEIIPKNLISIFNEKELELLICGLPEIDLNDLKNNTVYNKYTPASPQIQWFWQALESFDQEDRARFIQFVTGTSKVPLGGFSKLEGMNGPTKFQISLASMSTNHLPAAHTCFNSIDLPQYESYEKLHKCLLTAIRECSEGYGMI